METKRIKIIVEEKKTSDGKAFNAYKAVTKNGNIITAKFKKVVKNLPEKTCYANIPVDKMNVDKTKEFKTLWIEHVDSYEDIAEVQAERNKQELTDLFG